MMQTVNFYGAIGKRGLAWLSGKVFDSQSRGSGFEPHWILWDFCGSVLGQNTSAPPPSLVLVKRSLGQDTSEPQPCNGETQENHEQ